MVPLFLRSFACATTPRSSCGSQCRAQISVSCNLKTNKMDDVLIVNVLFFLPFRSGRWILNRVLRRRNYFEVAVLAWRKFLLGLRSPALPIGNPFKCGEPVQIQEVDALVLYHGSRRLATCDERKERSVDSFLIKYCLAFLRLCGREETCLPTFFPANSFCDQSIPQNSVEVLLGTRMISCIRPSMRNLDHFSGLSSGLSNDLE